MALSWWETAIIAIATGTVSWALNNIVGHNRNRREDGMRCVNAAIRVAGSASKLSRLRLDGESEAIYKIRAAEDGFDSAALELYLMAEKTRDAVRELRGVILHGETSDKSAHKTAEEIEQKLLKFLDEVRPMSTAKLRSSLVASRKSSPQVLS